MSSRRVTIVDIAQEMGISKSLVSNALHGRGRVSPQTREQVQETARRLGYVSNKAAQQLRSSRFGTLGLAIPSELRALSFYMQVTLGVGDACSEIGSDLMLYTSFSERSRVSLNVPLDGVIVCDPRPADPVVAQVADAHIPVVTIGHVGEEQADAVRGSVSIDFDALMADVFARLESEGGDRKVALLLLEIPETPVWLQEVRAAAAHEGRARRRSVQEVLLPASAEQGSLQHIVTRLLSQSYSSWIVAYQGLASILRGLVLEQLGADDAPPQIVALPGDPMSDVIDPRIISVDFRAHGYGHTAAEMLHEAISSPGSHSSRLHRPTILES